MTERDRPDGGPDAPSAASPVHFPTPAQSRESTHLELVAGSGRPPAAPPLPDLQVEHRPIVSLRLRRNNPRTHSEKQIRQIATSIERFGFINPVLIDASSTVIAGHGRVRAAKLLGLDSVPTIQLEHLTEAQVRAYVIADNRLAEQAGWDRDLCPVPLEG